MTTQFVDGGGVPTSEEWNQEERTTLGRGTERHIQVIDSERFVTAAALSFLHQDSESDIERDQKYSTTLIERDHSKRSTIVGGWDRTVAASTP